jgi:hypothetical protein
MSEKTDNYRRRHHECVARSEGCAVEIGALWLQIAKSYQFLADREERINAEDHTRTRKDWTMS